MPMSEPEPNYDNIVRKLYAKDDKWVPGFTCLEGASEQAFGAARVHFADLT